MALSSLLLDVDSAPRCTDLSNRDVKCLWFLWFPGFLEVRNRVLSLPVCCITAKHFFLESHLQLRTDGIQQRMSAAWTICTFPRTFVPGFLSTLWLQVNVTLFFFSAGMFYSGISCHRNICNNNILFCMCVHMALHVCGHICVQVHKDICTGRFKVGVGCLLQLLSIFFKIESRSLSLSLSLVLRDRVSL